MLKDRHMNMYRERYRQVAAGGRQRCRRADQTERTWHIHCTARTCSCTSRHKTKNYMSFCFVISPVAAPDWSQAVPVCLNALPVDLESYLFNTH